MSPRKQIVTDVFNMFDTDGSGEIELDEIARAFKRTGKLTDETRAQLKAHFEFMDSDGSGKHVKHPESYFVEIRSCSYRLFTQ